MAKSNPGKRQHRSMRGKIVDMEKLSKRNELTPAVGNVRVNARGDELGPGGKIVKRREDVVKEHYKAAGQVASDSDPIQKKEEPKTQEKPKPTRKTKSTKAVEAADQWLEDKDGNFVKKEGDK